MNHFVTLLFLAKLYAVSSHIYSKRDNILTARDLLQTIAPSNDLVLLPPGFPSLDSINTDKFSYKTTGNKIKVSANLDKPVMMYASYIKISNIKMNFTYNKVKPKKSWSVGVVGALAIGSTIVHVSIKSNGRMAAQLESISLRDIVSEFLKNNSQSDIGIDVSTIALENVTFNGQVFANKAGFQLRIKGFVVIPSLDRFKMTIKVAKQANSKVELYSIIEFRNQKPEKILKKIMNQKSLNIPFFAHMLAGSDLFSVKKPFFGVAISYGEVYNFDEPSISGEIIDSVLQSHIPIGVTLLSPLKISNNSRGEQTVNTAFVIHSPDFDLLIEQNDKLSVKYVLSIVSQEFSNIPANVIPKFITDLDDAFTTHVSFDASSNMFSIFVRLQEVTSLIPNLMKINVSNLVLQRNVALENKKTDWKVSAKGRYAVGKSYFDVQYSQIAEEPNRPYGLTGVAKSIELADIIDEYKPNFFPNEAAEEMIGNTEIENLKIHQVRLYSRILINKGTPHVLITGFTNLPAFEKDIQIALLLIYKGGEWNCKWATSFKHSPLSNIIQAMTGFDSRNLKLLHNSRILTTLISSPMASYSMLPPHIITTPLLRLPVKKALTIIALLRFPDNCGDDKMCESASQLLNTKKFFTVKGVLKLSEFTLRASIPYRIQLSDLLRGTNNTLQFTIGNDSRMDITTSVKIPKTDLVFDGDIHIFKTGKMQLALKCRKRMWLDPFDLPRMSITQLRLLMAYNTGVDLRWLRMEGIVKLGGDTGKIQVTAPINIDFNPSKPSASTFYANFSNLNLSDLNSAFDIHTTLPGILERSRFPSGLLLTYSGTYSSTPGIKLKGDIDIFDRRLGCEISIMGSGFMRVVTENSPAPLIFAKGQIIIQQDSKTKIRGPKIIADISTTKANVIAKGFVKILGIEDDVGIKLDDKDVRFSVTGKLMEYKETKLTAYSTGTTDTFQVAGCLADIAKQVQNLLIETISKSANQSIENMVKAEENLVNAQKYFEKADSEETRVRNHRDRARVVYEELLLDYGQFEVRANDTCVSEKCQLRCFGCPKLNKCCRLDIFGHCIACSNWKKCCWKNINPLCISKKDGCHVIRTAAEKDLAEKEAQILQHRIVLDNLDHFLSTTEVNKGKHQAVLEAALDAKEIVEEDSSPGLNAADAMRNFGAPYGWAKVNSVCYNTSIEQASTGCMQFHVAVDMFRKPEKNISIWSCLKEDLVTELTESLANYVFPNIIDTSTDDVSTVTAQLNEAQQMSSAQNKIDISGTQLTEKLPQLLDEVIDKAADLSDHMTNQQPGEYPSKNLPEQGVEDGDFGVGDSAVAEEAMQYEDGLVSQQLPVDSSIVLPANVLPINLAPGVPTYPSTFPTSNQTINPIGYTPPQLPLPAGLDLKPPQTAVQPDVSGAPPAGVQGGWNNVPLQTTAVPSIDLIHSVPSVPIVLNGSRGFKITGGQRVSGFLPYSGSGSGEGSASGYLSGMDEELEEILNKEASGEDENDVNTMSKINIKNNSPSDGKKEEDIADDIVEDEEESKDSQEPGVILIGPKGQRKKKNPLKTFDKSAQMAKEDQNLAAILRLYSKPQSSTLQSNRTYQQQATTNRTAYQPPAWNFTRVRVRRNMEAGAPSIITTPFSEQTNNALFSNPFWNVKSDRGASLKSLIPLKPQRQMMTNMIRKRWKIPENPSGRCHIFHQLIAICKDMAETIRMLYKSLTSARHKFRSEDKDVYLELFHAEEFITAAGKRVNVSVQVMGEAGDTLRVVRQGVNIWSKRCTNEFEWQNQSGVQSWLQAMDLRIQQLGGFGVYRFLENLFHAFEALFEALTYTDASTAKNALTLLQRIRRISTNFDKIFKEKLSIVNSRPYANDILSELEFLKKDSIFCSI